jgi:Predicted Zn-dependent protease (DUF2268)
MNSAGFSKSDLSVARRAFRIAPAQLVRSLRLCLVIVSLRLPALTAFAALNPSLPGPGPQIIDLVPQALQILGKQGQSEGDRATRFLQSFLEAHPEVYRRPQTWELDQKTAEEYLGKVPAYLGAIRDLHERFLREEPAVLARFCQAFPDFAPERTRIYLMLSLFRFDAKVPSDHPDSLLVGLDGLARFHGSQVPLSVILSHEFFHLYHFQVNPLPRNPDEIPLYRLLWQEGLAVYASRQLNPSASLADVLLDPRLANQGPAAIPSEAKRLLTCLDSQEDDVAVHFLAKSEGGTAPGRIGYLIGYEIVTRLAEKSPLSSLVRLRDPGLRFAFRRELYQLTKGTAGTP